MNRRRFLKTSTAAAVTAAAGSATAAVPGHLEVARGVITAWRRKDLEGMLAYIDDGIVWHSHVGSPPIVGKAAMREFAAKLTGQMAEIRWRIFYAAADGDRLHVEGVDDYTAPDGRRVVVPYAGVFAFRGGLVVEWRDYFDRALFDRIKAGEAVPAYVEELVNRPALF
jgi:limonene-1,2-epoxide hydrolase